MQKKDFLISSSRRVAEKILTNDSSRGNWGTFQKKDTIREKFFRGLEKGQHGPPPANKRQVLVG